MPQPSIAAASSTPRGTLEVVAQHVDRDRDGLRDVHQHQAGQRAAQPEHGEQHEQRDRQHDRGEQVDRQEQEVHLPAAEEAQPRHRVRAGDRDQQRRRHSGDRDDRAVAHEGQEPLAAQNVGVRGQGEAPGEQRARVQDQLLDVAHRQHHHVQERERGDREQHRDRHGPQHRQDGPLEPVAAHSLSSSAPEKKRR
ncbi:hypothetical protein [Thermocatellispora tengchongensis]|uniref:hypothetical protein n=1 Tax=Thermocatellispora tengchongensis TaxID=1073253 RepID=UPI003637A720